MSKKIRSNLDSNPDHSDRGQKSYPLDHVRQTAGHVKPIITIFTMVFIPTFHKTKMELICGNRDLFGLFGYTLFIIFSEKVFRTNKSLSRGSDDNGTTKLTIMYMFLTPIFPFLLKHFSLMYGDFSDLLSCSIYTTMAFSLLLIFFLRYWAMSTLGEHFSRTLRTTSSQTIIQTGPYKYVRHPGYTASYLIGFWVFIMISPSFSAISMHAIWFYFIYKARIQSEESMLMKAFPGEYEKYMKRTSRLIPYVF